MFPKVLNYSFNQSMNTVSLNAAWRLPAPLHVLIFSFLAPAPPCILPSRPVPPPTISLANSGSNETSIWPVRNTQTSLPLWEEEPRTCWCEGRSELGIIERKAGDGQVLRDGWRDGDAFAKYDLSSHGPSPWRAVLSQTLRLPEARKLAAETRGRQT